MAKAKVCYVSPLSIHSQRWAEALSERGYDIFFISDSRSWVTGATSPTPVHVLAAVNRTNFPRRLIPNTLRIMKILKGVSPSFVHLHVQHYYSPAIFLSGFPFILTTWGAEVLELPGADAFRKSIAKIAATKACKVTVDAGCLKKIWVKLGVPENKIEVIPFGVDLGIFNPDVDGRAVRRRLGIGKKDIVIISTRPFYNDHYNVECLVRAIPLILSRHSNVKFIIKGTGPLENYLRSLANELDISKHIHFVGLVPHHEVAQLLSAADIYVSTCFIDSTSVSLLEAMACGLAPVVTDIAGNREWVKNGVNGFLFPPRNSKALAEKVSQLIEDSGLRKSFGEKCFEKVKKYATWENCVSKMEAIYQSLI